MLLNEQKKRFMSARGCNTCMRGEKSNALPDTNSNGNLGWIKKRWS